MTPTNVAVLQISDVEYVTHGYNYLSIRAGKN